MRNHKTLLVNGRTHVVVESSPRTGSRLPEPNFMGTGMALCGVLKKNETFDDWYQRIGKSILG